MQDQDPAPSTPFSSVGRGQYEFTAEQNVVIGKLASRMRLAGIAQVAFGALQLLGNCSLSTSGGGVQFSSASSPIYLALLVTGALLITASMSFKRIVDTEGNDISHLMEALGRFSTSIFVQLITYLLLALVIMLLILVVAVLLLFFAAALASVFSP